MIYLQPGTVSQSRQASDCLAHCNLRRYRIVAVVRPEAPEDAITCVTGSAADLVVSAYSPRARPGDLRDLAAAAGVRVEYVRAPVVRREIAQLIARLYRRAGGDAAVVADQLGMTSQEIRSTVARLDELRNDTPPRSHRRAGRRNDGR